MSATGQGRTQRLGAEAASCLKILAVTRRHGQRLLVGCVAVEAWMFENNLGDLFMHAMHHRRQGGNFLAQGIGKRFDVA